MGTVETRTPGPLFVDLATAMIVFIPAGVPNLQGRIDFAQKEVKLPVFRELLPSESLEQIFPPVDEDQLYGFFAALSPDGKEKGGKVCCFVYKDEAHLRAAIYEAALGLMDNICFR